MSKLYGKLRFMPAAQYRLGSEATANRTYDIAKVRPVNGNYTFFGWATENGGIPEYGAEGFYETTTNYNVSPSYTFSDTTAYQALYAMWAQKYSLYYVANAGDDQVTNMPDQQQSLVSNITEIFTVTKIIPVRAR